MAPKAKAKSVGRRSTSRSLNSSRAVGTSSASPARAEGKAAAKARGGAPFLPKAKQLSTAVVGDPAFSAPDFQNSSLAALFGGRRLVRCSGCNVNLEEDQPMYPCSDNGHFFCRACAAASLVSKRRRCCMCNGFFGPGQEVYQCPTDAQMFACQGCVNAIRQAATERPACCDQCKEPFSPESRIFASNAAKPTYLCSACAESKNAEQPKSCSTCQLPFAEGQKIYRCNDEDGKFVCEACKEASLPVCAACGQVVRSKVRMLDGRPFHVDCLHCCKCASRLEDGRCYQAADGKLMCEDCRKEQLSLAVAGLGFF